MAEVENHDLQESKIDLAPKDQEFIPDPKGVVKVQTPHGLVTIVPGHTEDGEESAIVFGVDSPLELLAAKDDTRESEGFLSNLPRGPLGMIAAGITMAAGAVVGAGAALSACAPNPDQPNQPTYGTHQGALTVNDILNVGKGTQIPWSVDWDNHPSNLGQMNGENYLFFVNNYSNDGVTKFMGVKYVKCQALADCFSPNAEVKILQGLEAAGMYGSYSGPGLFKDKNGKDKFIIDPQYGFESFGVAEICDIGPNSNGTLEVSNCTAAIPPCEIAVNDGVIEMVNCDGGLPPIPVIDGEPSTFTKNGIPYTLWSPGTIRNLHTNETQETALYDTDWANACGVGVETEDGTAVIGAQRQVIQGVTHCRLVTASSWAELVASPIALQSLNQGSKDLESPRLFGNYIVYSRDYKLWFVEIPAPPQNPDPDTGSPDADADQPDAGSPDADADQPDTAQPDAIPPEADQPDADVVEPDTEVDQPDAAEVAEATADAAEAVVEDADAQPELPPDNSPDADSGPDVQPPDTTPDIQNPACSFANPKLTIPQGCQLENCADPFADINGKCTFSVDLGKDKPVTIELDGTYQVDFLEKIGAHLAGKYKIIDNDNIFNTVAGNLGTGVEGTIYSGEFMAGSNYQLSCQEGSIKVFLIKGNGEKELLATLDGGETQIFDLYNPKPQPEQNPEPQPETQPEPSPEPQPEPDPDASQPESANDTGSPKPEPASDAGPTQSEPNSPTETTKDASPPVTQKPPSNDGGCNITGNLNATAENLNSTGHLATIALALIALGATIRRRLQR